MKIFLVWLLCLFCFTICECGNSKTISEPLSEVEKVAAINIKAWFKHDFEQMLETYPTFRIAYMGENYGVDDKYNVNSVANTMREYFSNSEPKNVEILNTGIIFQDTVDDFSMYYKLKSRYTNLTYDEFKKISEYAFVRVEYRWENTVAELEVKCLKISGKWYVLDSD